VAGAAVGNAVVVVVGSVGVRVEPGVDDLEAAQRAQSGTKRRARLSRA